MSTLLIHPPFDGPPSGGHTYNHCIIEQAGQTGYPLQPVPVSPDRFTTSNLRNISQAPDALILIDSLLAFTPGHFPNWPQTARLGLLLHYLPSANPQLDEIRRIESRRIEDRVITAMQLIICTGESMQELLQRRYPDKTVRLCEPGVSSVFNTACFEIPGAKPGSEIQLITVANYVPAKGYEFLLKILTDLQDRNWQWHWVGEDITQPPHSETLLAQVNRLGLDNRIHRPVIANQGALAELMAKTDIMLSASHFESYGMAIAEAVASGLAVISTQVGEASRLIDQGQNGYVVPLGKYDVYTQLLAGLIDRPERLATFKSKARAMPTRTWAHSFDDFALACQVGKKMGAVQCP